MLNVALWFHRRADSVSADEQHFIEPASASNQA